MKREDLVRWLQPLARLTHGLSPNARRGLLAGGLLLPVCLYVGLRTSCAGATPSPELEPAAPLAAAAAIVDDGGVEAPVIEPVKTTATVVFITTPAVHATVTWGKKRLGIIKPGYPLTVVRPRDSGPLDVVVKAEGYLPVQTRAYTFNDSKMIVKLTRPEAINTLLGYRVPIEAGLPVGVDEVDGGVPSTTGSAWP